MSMCTCTSTYTACISMLHIKILHAHITYMYSIAYLALDKVVGMLDKFSSKHFVLSGNQLLLPCFIPELEGGDDGMGALNVLL